VNRRSKGMLAERLAACFLRLKGYSILASGYRFRGKEIDVVARDGANVVFVEVKFRSGRGKGLPRESVGALKQRHIAFAASGFLVERGLEDAGCRFDVIEIEMRQGGLAMHLEHLPGAFRPGRG
jgi:putative endonuclease